MNQYINFQRRRQGNVYSSCVQMADELKLNPDHSILILCKHRSDIDVYKTTITSLVPFELEFKEATRPARATHLLHDDFGEPYVGTTDSFDETIFIGYTITKKQ